MLALTIRRNAVELVLLGLALVFICLAAAGAVSAYFTGPVLGYVEWLSRILCQSKFRRLVRVVGSTQ
jgi:hypothetical protein